MCENCKSENSLECEAIKRDMPFYKTMGLGYDCSCTCHVHSDEQTVEDFRRFLRETKEAGIHPTPIARTNAQTAQ